MNLAHGAAVDILRARVPGSSIGAIHNYQPCLPSTPNDTQAAEYCDAYWNKAFPDPQCLGVYPGQIEAAMEAHMQAGDLARIRRPVDWFGLNHYSPVFVKADRQFSARLRLWRQTSRKSRSRRIGWPIMPHSFRETLLDVSKRYGLPVYVLENGFGGHDKPDDTGAVIDNDRIAYLRAYIGAHERGGCARAPTFAAISSGPCSTISNGTKVTACGLD